PLLSVEAKPFIFFSTRKGAKVIQQIGQTVEINGRLIPAVNIQVDGMPDIINGHPYNTYFEIMFDEGGLFVVSQDLPDPEVHDDILVEYYLYWGMADENADVPSYTKRFATWDEFLDDYDLHLACLYR